MDPYLCLDAIPNIFGLFDTTVAPTLLYYSYLPIILVSLLFSIFIFIKNPSIQAKALLVLAVTFSIWVLNEIVQWIAVDSWLVHFGWQLSALLQVAVVSSVLYFVYLFLFKKYPSFYQNLIGFILVIPIILVLPTKLNMDSFDFATCQAYNGFAWFYIYGLEVLATLIIIAMCIKKYLSTKDIVEKKLATYLGFGVAIFLGLFVETNIAGDWTLVYEFNLLGPLGMAIFILFISYTIVKYSVFNLKLIGAQVLVATLWVMLCAILFIRTIENAKIVISLTLIIFLIVGIFLIRSIRKEIEQREHIQKLAENLEAANKKLKVLDNMKSEFLSLASHQIRSPLTAIKGYSSMLAEGDFGKLPQKASNAASIIMESCQNLIDIVEDFLNISRIEQGRMVYENSIFDIRGLVEEIINEIKPNIDKAGLDLKIQLGDEKILVNVDRGKIKQSISNIIDNATKYTPKGGIKISVSKSEGMAKVSVKDSGIGINPSEIDKLFIKFSRTKDASKTNVSGTGLGLYIAKKMIEASGGSIKVISSGKEEGATFTVELPEYKQ